MELFGQADLAYRCLHFAVVLRLFVIHLTSDEANLLIALAIWDGLKVVDSTVKSLVHLSCSPCAPRFSRGVSPSRFPPLPLGPVVAWPGGSYPASI